MKNDMQFFAQILIFLNPDGSKKQGGNVRSSMSGWQFMYSMSMWKNAKLISIQTHYMTSSWNWFSM